MKKQMLGIVKELREKGIDFKNGPPHFKWIYEEEPHLEFNLLIVETDQASFPLESTLH